MPTTKRATRYHEGGQNRKCIFSVLLKAPLTTYTSLYLTCMGAFRPRSSNKGVHIPVPNSVELLASPFTSISTDLATRYR